MLKYTTMMMMLVSTRAGPLRLQLTSVDRQSQYIRGIYLGMLTAQGATSATAPASCLEHVHYYLNLAAPNLVDFINGVVDRAQV